MARAQPGKLNWVSTTGATDLILHAYIKKSGLDMVRVPYRNPVEALTDTVNGRVHIYWAAHAAKIMGGLAGGFVAVRRAAGRRAAVSV